MTNYVDEINGLVKSTMINDPAHDYQHIMRVYKNAIKICKHENVEQRLVLLAVLLHDIVSYPKSDKRSKLASLHSSKKAKEILGKYSFDKKEIKIICDAIRDHSYSKNKTPSTMVGKILQDADRLDAVGAIGIARVFSVSGSEKRSFYDVKDPFCRRRAPDDKTWAIDHFYQKLLKLESLMNTNYAKKEAKRRTRIIKKFLLDLKNEL